MQAGFFFSARVGSGLVIARTRDGGWSAPSAVCTAGAGWGLQIGGEVTDMLVVLNSQDAARRAASTTAQISLLGTEIGMAVGPALPVRRDGGHRRRPAAQDGDGLLLRPLQGPVRERVALHACVV